MAASVVVAASAVAISGVTATATGGLYPALIGFVGTVVGAAIAQGAAMLIAHRSSIAAARREASGRTHALRILVADKRIAVHQGAFKRVKQLLSAGRDTKVIDEVNDWMDDNCLYLSAEARKAVWTAIGNAKARALSLAESDSVGLEPKHRVQYSDLALKNFDAIMTAFKPVVDGAELPALGSDELDIIAESARGDDRQRAGNVST